MIKVKYIGKERLTLIPGKVYDAKEITDDTRFFSVKDEENEFYAYPKSLFEIVE